MVKRHLKRHATPNTWPIPRKTTKFVVKPRSGSHRLAQGMAISTVLKFLELCETTKEVKYALTHSEVLVNNKRVKDFKFMVGFMDVLSVPEKGLFYRMSLGKNGKLAMVAIDKKEAELVLCSIVGIRKVASGKLQYNCHNGYNFLVDKHDYKRLDTLIYNAAKRKIEGKLPLEPGAPVLLISGGFAGAFGTFIKAEGSVGEIKLNGKSHKTALKYIFPIGDKLTIR